MCVAGLQELSDIVVKTNVTAVDILNARVSEAFNEAKALFGEPVVAPTITAPPAIAEAATVAEENPDALAAQPIAVVEEVSNADAIAPVEPAQSVIAAPTPAPKAARSTKAARLPRRR